MILRMVSKALNFKMRFLNKRELKNIFGKENLDNIMDFAFYEANDFFYVISRDIGKINSSDFNVRRAGLNAGKLINNKIELNEIGERFFKMRKISFF